LHVKVSFSIGKIDNLGWGVILSAIGISLPAIQFRQFSCWAPIESATKWQSVGQLPLNIPLGKY